MPLLLSFFKDLGFFWYQCAISSALLSSAMKAKEITVAFKPFCDMAVLCLQVNQALQIKKNKSCKWDPKRDCFGYLRKNIALFPSPRTSPWPDSRMGWAQPGSALCTKGARRARELSPVCSHCCALPDEKSITSSRQVHQGEQCPPEPCSSWGDAEFSKQRSSRLTFPTGLKDTGRSWLNHKMAAWIKQRFTSFTAH